MVSFLQVWEFVDIQVEVHKNCCAVALMAHMCEFAHIRALADRSVLKSGVQESTIRLNQKQA